MIGNFIGHGHVYHSRKEGISNSFRYPSFFLLFPCADEIFLKDQLRVKYKNVLSVRAQDYLQGLSGDLGENVKKFMKVQCDGFEPQQVWLHTLPRMFGYAFNPVSFWFCLRDSQLEAVLVEVNNTFGERHFYWIHPKDGIQKDQWYKTEKQFHVSPFFPVDGYYQFRFQLNAQGSRVDINHHSPDGKLRLATWVEGVHSPFQSHSLISILFRYGWITPMVVVRIHWQALRLWLKKTRYYSKPKLPSKELSS